jgi:hypothetical protein
MFWTSLANHQRARSCIKHSLKFFHFMHATELPAVLLRAENGKVKKRLYIFVCSLMMGPISSETYIWCFIILSYFKTCTVHFYYFIQ